MALFSGLRRLFDPDRLATPQSPLAQDYATSAALAERFRQLQADRERLRTWGKNPKRNEGAGFLEPGASGFDAPPPSDDEFDSPTSPARLLLAQRTTSQPAVRARGNIGTAAEATGGSDQNRSVVGNVMDNVRRMTENSGEVVAASRAKGINGFGYVPAAGDVNWLARALYSEFGRFNNWRDMPAGAATIINRIRPNGNWPVWRNELRPTLTDVLETTNRDGTRQYSFMPPGGLHAAHGSDQWEESAHPERLTGDSRKAWELAASTARAFLEGQPIDPTGGATYFRHRSAPEDDFWRSLVPSPYQSPNGENFFYHVTDEPPRPVRTMKPIIRGHSPRGPLRK